MARKKISKFFWFNLLIGPLVAMAYLMAAIDEEFKLAAVPLFIYGGILTIIAVRYKSLIPVFQSIGGAIIGCFIASATYFVVCSTILLNG